MELSQMLQLPHEVLYLWHEYRTEVLLSAGILVAIVRLALYFRHRKSQIALQPLNESPEKSLIAQEIKRNPILESKAPATSNKLKPREPRRIKGTKPLRSSQVTQQAEATPAIQPIIFYFTLGGSTKAYAETLAASLSAAASTSAGQVLAPQLHDLTELDYDDYFITPPSVPKPDGTGVAADTQVPLPTKTQAFYALLLPSYDIDSELANFLAHLQETHHDFRIDTAPLAGLAGYSVFGLGDRGGWPTEGEGFCAQAVEADRWLARLTGRRRAYPLGTGDVACGREAVQQSLEEWTTGVAAVLRELGLGHGLGEGVPGSGDAVESGDEDDVLDDEGDDGEDVRPKRQVKTRKGGSAADLEDLKAPIPVDFTTSSASAAVAPTGPKAMVPKTSPTYASLTKQGYTIVGTHSGVKICRWTKSALRGRGSCYKFSFYGIASHQCMEATPALSCSNKCVFCWRHGTNPVGTTWRWQVDAPGDVFAGIKAGHYHKIKMLRGVPGLRSERFAEALRVRHCALSLVGEPIFYPHINALLALLHGEHISSFLVCNAQHPDQLAALGPVTQLYVSIDAPDKATLRAIDRPLHRDFWERFLRCMDILAAKRASHRTVFRLTLVKRFNAALADVAGYADLVQRASPSFIEVKGVTYCGTSTAAGAGLSMANVPFYEEVCAFVLALRAELARRGLDYGIAAEHAHSCCILLADTARYFRPAADDGVRRWHTLIDYPKFFECVHSGRAFGPEDYISATPTPEWALWGNGGFDPRDQRVDRKGRPKAVEINRNTDAVNLMEL